MTLSVNLNINIDGVKLGNVDKFKYLEVTLDTMANAQKKWNKESLKH